MQVSERIKSERKRLGYSQTELAEIAHATRGTVANWEGGAGSPDADALAAMANVGLDVLYVVTGDHSFVPPRKLSSEEETMLGYFKEASPAARKAALRELLSAVPGQVGGNYSQHNSGANAVQIGSHSGKVTVQKRR
jgi:transcriptional regulator with XRE-family HTH domain